VGWSSVDQQRHRQPSLIVRGPDTQCRANASCYGILVKMRPVAARGASGIRNLSDRRLHTRLASGSICNTNVNEPHQQATCFSLVEERHTKNPLQHIEANEHGERARGTSVGAFVTAELPC
jgi:hypothetical protein